jgi:hypothetical protein
MKNFISKFAKIWGFGYENIPSGNPGLPPAAICQLRQDTLKRVPKKVNIAKHLFLSKENVKDIIW